MVSFLILKNVGNKHDFHFDLRILSSNRINRSPSWELTYPLPAGTFDDDFPFPILGSVSCLWYIHLKFTRRIDQPTGG